jgi:uncharacterized cofD-like protein
VTDKPLNWTSLWHGRRRWLTVGMGIKRWLLILGFGATLVGIGLAQILFVIIQWGDLPGWLHSALTLAFLPLWLRMLLPLSVGILVAITALFHLSNTLIAPFQPADATVADSLYDYQRRHRGPQIVAIGGGTGMPALLRGLSEHTSRITAVVTVADDGGSSGRLRRELGVLPPGDFRNNIAALSRDEALMTQLLQYRFGGRLGAEADRESTSKSGPGDLQGHAFGNLLLAALVGVTGSFDEALLAAERVLAMRGRVLPSTLDQVALVAEVAVTDAATGATAVQRIVGESAIPQAGGQIQHIALEPANVRAYPPAVQAILQADLVILGPGSLYTSIIPNLLVPELARALQQTRAPKLYICNLATQPGETDNYTVADHVAAITRHLALGCLDFVLANDNLSLPPERGGGHTRFVPLVAPSDVRLITADLADNDRPWRHDSTKLAAAVMEVLSTQRQK